VTFGVAVYYAAVARNWRGGAEVICDSLSRPMRFTSHVWTGTVAYLQYVAFTICLALLALMVFTAVYALT
jgi:hypothetical protein